MIKNIKKKVNEKVLKLAIRRKCGFKGSAEELFWIILIIAVVFFLREPLQTLGKTIIDAVQVKATEFLTGI